jgi:glycosyltransferase involved in cell wall biosynthesis
LTQEEVRKLYACSDFFLNLSKAEGMSYPILEAMSVGVPVICTDATAMRDHVNGIPGMNKTCAIGLKADYIHIDVFGNSNRYYIFPDTIAHNITSWTPLLTSGEQIPEMIKNAQEYIDWRNNQNSVDLLKKAFENG